MKSAEQEDSERAERVGARLRAEKQKADDYATQVAAWVQKMADRGDDRFAEIADLIRDASKPPVAAAPPHYAGAVTPWDLEKDMRSSGDVFTDARLTDAIEYAARAFRKGAPAADIRKAIHCLEEALLRRDKWHATDETRQN